MIARIRPEFKSNRVDRARSWQKKRMGFGSPLFASMWIKISSIIVGEIRSHSKQTFAQHARAGRVWSNVRSFGTEHMVSPSLNPLARGENVFQADYRANIVPRSVTVLLTRRPRLLTLFRTTSHATMSTVRGSHKGTSIIGNNSLILYKHLLFLFHTHNIIKIFFFSYFFRSFTPDSF